MIPLLIFYSLFFQALHLSSLQYNLILHLFLTFHLPLRFSFHESPFLVSFVYHSSPSSGTLFIPFCSQSSTLSVRLFSRHCSSALLMGPLGRGERSRLRVQRQRVDGKLNFVSARAKITRDSARKTPLGPYEDGIFNFHRGEPLSRDCLPARSYGKYTSILASSAKSRNFERFRICQPSD